MRARLGTPARGSHRPASYGVEEGADVERSRQSCLHEPSPLARRHRSVQPLDHLHPHPETGPHPLALGFRRRGQATNNCGQGRGVPTAAFVHRGRAGLVKSRESPRRAAQDVGRGRTQTENAVKIRASRLASERFHFDSLVPLSGHRTRRKGHPDSSVVRGMSADGVRQRAAAAAQRLDRFTCRSATLIGWSFALPRCPRGVS
jgi:hypothetical protein